MDAAGVNWCKNTTKEKRENYFVNNGGKLNKTQEEITFETGAGAFISNNKLNSDTLKLIEKLPPLQGVIGIPRSGMIPASIISVNLSLPLYSLSDNKLVLLNSMSPNGGSRMSVYEQNKSNNLLLIDDTAYSGAAMKKNKLLVESILPSSNIITSVLYSTPEAIKKNLVEISMFTVEFPHILEWNLFNAHPTLSGMFDLDGVFCEDCPYEIAENEKRYEDWINNVNPIKTRIPKLFPASAICTGRLEKYRQQTEKWLKKHEIKYSNLIMFQGTKEERDSNHLLNVAKYKTKNFIEYNKKYNCKYFTESCPMQSKIISENKPMKSWVISINEKKTY